MTSHTEAGYSNKSLHRTVAYGEGSRSYWDHKRSHVCLMDTALKPHYAAKRAVRSIRPSETARSEVTATSGTSRVIDSRDRRGPTSEKAVIVNPFISHKVALICGDKVLDPCRQFYFPLPAGQWEGLDV
ncbi:hypothetical protein Bbelb_074140 [Branchiostoma belcheri]|nr:hypothetical protein Bbelb_074140 [Branchiostoma belcheri]